MPTQDEGDLFALHCLIMRAFHASGGVGKMRDAARRMGEEE